MKPTNVNEVIEQLIGFRDIQKELIKDIVRKESDKQYNQGFINGQNDIICSETIQKEIEDKCLKSFRQGIKESTENEIDFLEILLEIDDDTVEDEINRRIEGLKESLTNQK